MRKATFILWGLLGLAGTLPCGAQITGAITGSVVDVTSSLVQKATVVVKNLGTGAERQLVTDSGGRFTAEQLPVGSYEVTVTASGFKKAVRTGLELNVADRLGVEFRLEVGQISETISVTAEGSAGQDRDRRRQLSDQRETDHRTFHYQPHIHGAPAVDSRSLADGGR